MPGWQSWIDLGIAVGVALLVAVAISLIVGVIGRLLARRHDWARALVSNARHPFRLLLAVNAIWFGLAVRPFPAEDWRDSIDHILLILDIALLAWMLGAVLSFALGRVIVRNPIDVPDNRVARRVQTQLALVRRLALAAIVVIGIASILLTFPGVQALGASLLASAGLVSIVAGLAAQSTLANVFAGIQLAFSDAIRVDDVVIVEGEWGRIEEITLTYVVVHIWDDRRMVLPSTHFTTTPFQNWTRHSSELLGSIEFDLDWRVAPSEMRVKLDEILEGTDLWDGRAHVLQVTEALGGYVRIRILVTAIDAPTLFDLRCHVREQMVEWLHTKDAESLPVTRVEMVEPVPRERVPAPAGQHEGLFSGSKEAEERAATFTTPVPIHDPDRGSSASRPGA